MSDKNSNKDLKKKSTEIIGTFSSLLEKTAHKTIDKTGEFTGFMQNKIKEGFESFSGGVNDFVDILKQVDIETLEPGDLVVSKTDIKKKDGTIIHHTGEVFEFSEDLIPLLGNTQLFVPDLKTAVAYARIDELKRINTIPQEQIPSYVKQRYNKLSRPKEKEEPANA